MFARTILSALAVVLVAGPAWPKDDWIELSSGKDALAGWRSPTGKWFTASRVQIDPHNPRRLTAEPGEGIIVNGQRGDTHDLRSKQSFGDVRVHAEFLIPHHSNSGIKLEGLYEIQIFDSYGKKHLTGADCGGVYPRAEMEPMYHHIDNGTPPRVNACRAPGQWQTLDIEFRGPRFDKTGHKTADARFVKVVLNGQVIHENVALHYPTGHAWRLEKEKPTGPLLLQGDHGPVAFRHVRVEPLSHHS